MAMLTQGLNKIRDLHAAAVTQMQLGTDGSATAESMTALQAPVTATRLAVTITQADKANAFEYTLPSTTGTGNTYRESALELADNTAENRNVFTGIIHTANDDIVIRQIINYKNG